MKPNINKNSRYMKQQEDKYGPNFIGIKSTKDMYRDMPRIISELSNGNLDVNQYGYIFLTEQFQQSATQYCCDQMNLLAILDRNYNAFQIIGQLTEFDIDLWTKIKKKYEAYEYIYRTILLVMNTCSYEPMKRLQADLNKNYRNYLQRGVTI